MLRTGEAQFIFPVPPEQAKTLTGSDNLEVTVSPSIIERYVAFNTKIKPFNDVRVRKALNYAVNKEALAKVAFSGYAVPATGSAPEGVDYAKVYEPWPYDPKKARELLKEAGYPNGFTATLWSLYNHTTAQKVIQFLQQQFAQVGVKVSILAMEAGQRNEYLLKNLKMPSSTCSMPVGRAPRANLTGRSVRCLLRQAGRRWQATTAFIPARCSTTALRKHCSRRIVLKN